MDAEQLPRSMHFLLLRIVLIAVILSIWWWASGAQLSDVMNLSTSRVAWITTFVHFAVMILLGVAIIRALTTHHDWSGWVLPVPPEIGLPLVILTGAASLATVANLALKGFGAPFFIALSRKLAADWLYGWTRHPMVLTSLTFLLSLGIWFQSVLFVLWVLIFVVPALLFIVKVYEERELEIRFGA